MPPLVSVIIPVYNYERYVSQAIDSVLGQTYPNIEIIAVDDGSSDGSRKIIESYGERIKAIYQTNQGVSAARNNGVAMSVGDFIAFLDADDVWMPEKIAKQMGLICEHEHLGMIHVGVENIDADGNRISTELNGMEGWVADALLLLEPVILGGGSGILVRRTAFDATGGFDPRMSTSADWDLFLRVADRYQVGFVAEILLKYRIHASNMHNNIDRMHQDVLLGYQKALKDPDSNFQAIKHKAYGKLHRVLAGSYFHAGRYLKGAEHGAKSVWFARGSITRLFRTAKSGR